MTTAELTQTASGTTVRVGQHRRAIEVRDGETFADAADRTVAEIGWTVTGPWVQTFGGITGAVHEAPVMETP